MKRKKITFVISAVILFSAILVIIIPVIFNNRVPAGGAVPNSAVLPQIEEGNGAQPPPAASAENNDGGNVSAENAVLENIPPTNSAGANVMTPGKFPSLHITSSHNPFEVERNFWHDGTLSLTNHVNGFENVAIRIRGRGNSTWHFGEEKRPLRIRFEEPQSFADASHIARDWVLIANHFDLTLMRTYLAFYLSSHLDGMYWSPFSQFVNLYINGEYLGLYQLADERDADTGRARLTAHGNPAVSEYLFELAHSVMGTGELGTDYIIVNGMPYDLRFPGNRYRNGHMDYLYEFISNVENVARAGDFEAISQVVDIPSFIDFYLVQEFFKNIDVGFNSVFMQIRGQNENRRLHFGPVWDFDRSAGNMYYWDTYEHLHAAVRNNLFRLLMSNPEIFELAARRWEEIVVNEVQKMLTRMENLIDVYGGEFKRNFERHPVWGTNPPWMTQMLPQYLRVITSWEGQVDFLREWFTGRVWWMNQLFVVREETLTNWWVDYLTGGVRD
jgi:hypothetical protein